MDLRKSMMFFIYALSPSPYHSQLYQNPPTTPPFQAAEFCFNLSVGRISSIPALLLPHPF